MITADAISVVDLPVNGVLDIVVSDTPEGQIQNWLINQTFRETRLYGPLHSAELEEQYDVVLIDTQGAVGPLQDAAALAADILISPIVPETLSACDIARRCLIGAAIRGLPRSWNATYAGNA